MIKRIIAIAGFLCAWAAGAQTTQPITQPHQTFVDGSGNPCSACLLYSYAAGTTTPQATYISNSVGGGTNTNPIVLDAAGGAQIWLGQSPYKLVLQTALGSTIWTVDNVSGGSLSLACLTSGCTFTGSISGTSATFTGPFTDAVTGAAGNAVTASAPGIFTNLASHSANQGLVNSASLAMFLSSGPSNYTQDGVTGAVIVPSTATVSQVNGVDGMTDNYTTSNALAAMGGYFQVTGHGVNENLWGINTVGIIQPGSTGTALENEVDFDVYDANATVYGWHVAAPYWNSAPSVSYGYLLSTPGGTSGAKWTSAFYATPGASSNGVELLELNVATPSVSQPITMIGGTSNGTQYNTSIQADATGNILLNPATGQSVISPKFGGNPTFTGRPSIASFDGSVNPNFVSIGANGLVLSPATNGGATHELYGSNAANSAVNWFIDDAGDAFFETLNVYNSARTFAGQFTFSGTANRAIVLPDGPSGTVMPWSLSTTSGTSDNVTVTGMTSGGHCSIAATNASAATNFATTYISAKSANQITITHTGTASMTYDGLCTNN